MKRIQTLLWAGILSMLFSCSVKNTQDNTEKDTTAKTKRPNIIFIMSDDHAYQAISAYSDKLINTPNIDRIANEGMLFDNACVTNSICAPSRAVILTGKHSHINGKMDNLRPFDWSQTTFPQLFKQAGYNTAIYGKLHFGNNPKGVDDYMILPGQGFYINPKFHTPQGDTTVTGYATDIITDFSLDWLKEHKEDEKPFMLMYLHKAPHRPWWPRPDKFKEFTKKTFPEPATLFDDYKTRGEAAKTAEMTLLTHLQYGHDMKIKPETIKEMGDVQPKITRSAFEGFDKPYTERVNEEQKKLYEPILDSINTFFKENWANMSDKEKIQWKYQRFMQDYLGCISSVDDNVGRVLDYLDESGLAENTIVVYTSDQGFYLGEHGWFDKRFIYNESFKTPLLVRWPNKIKAGSVNTQMVQNLDFAQTLMDAADIKAPSDMQGESFLPLLTGNDKEWKRDGVYYHYYEYPGTHMVKRHYGIVTEDYKLIHFYHDVDEWELYDRKNDPSEVNNVYDNPEYQDVVKKMQKELDEMRAKYQVPEDTFKLNKAHASR